MFGLDNKSGINVMPPIAPADSQTPLWFTEGGAGLSATYPGQDWFNQIQAELLNVLKAADIAPQKGSLTQLSSAISKLASAYALSVVQSPGQSLTGVMSQKAVTDLVTGINIPVAADLNNYKEPGDYYQNSSDMAASGKNYPAPYAGHLRVEKAAGVIQIYRHYITGQQWQRSFYDNSWTIWLEFSHIRPGKIELTGFRNGEIGFGWYLMNGDRYPVTSLVGKALLSLSANFRQDWGIVESGGMINIPDIQQADGRAPFLRPINKTGRQVGSVEQDAQRKITGFLHDVYGGPSLSVDGAFDKSAVYESTYYATRTQSDLKFKFLGNCNFDSSLATQTASENRSLNIGMNAVIYLGV